MSDSRLAGAVAMVVRSRENGGGAGDVRSTTASGVGLSSDECTENLRPHLCDIIQSWFTHMVSYFGCADFLVLQ